MRQRRGTSLIEVLVSMCLIAVTCLFVVSVLPSLVSSVHRQRDRWVVAMKARDLILSHTVKYDFTKVLSETATLSSTTEAHGRSHVLRGTQTYQGTLTGDDDRKVVTVRTTWTDAAGPHEVILETIECKL